METRHSRNYHFEMKVAASKLGLQLTLGFGWDTVFVVFEVHCLPQQNFKSLEMYVDKDDNFIRAMKFFLLINVKINITTGFRCKSNQESLLFKKKGAYTTRKIMFVVIKL